MKSKKYRTIEDLNEMDIKLWNDPVYIYKIVAIMKSAGFKNQDIVKIISKMQIDTIKQVAKNKLIRIKNDIENKINSI